ncbi:hypothetical protein DFH94DRAFT_639415, partial [Russula ochroleuca]
TPLVIYNCSTSLRFGFTTSATPQVVSSIVSKYKERKAGTRAGKQFLLFGDAVDYAFVHLGVDSSVDHPVVMTE